MTRQLPSIPHALTQTKAPSRPEILAAPAPINPRHQCVKTTKHMAKPASADTKNLGNQSRHKSTTSHPDTYSVPREDGEWELLEEEKIDKGWVKVRLPNKASPKKEVDGSSLAYSPLAAMLILLGKSKEEEAGKVDEQGNDADVEESDEEEWVKI